MTSSSAPAGLPGATSWPSGRRCWVRVSAFDRSAPVRPVDTVLVETQEAPEEDLVELDPERRARLVTFVEGNEFMPDEAKARVLAQLKEDRVPARMVERIESRMN